jgi:hypothetical protein
LGKKIKVSICIILIGSILILLGCYVRVDRFGIAQISWVDCIQINNTKYYSDFDRSPVEYSDIGKKIGKVKFNVSEKVHNPNYRFRNGDATYLEIGTEVYSLQSNSNVIAVKIDDDYFLYKSN